MLLSFLGHGVSLSNLVVMVPKTFNIKRLNPRVPLRSGITSPLKANWWAIGYE